MAGIGRQGRVEDAADLGLLLKPLGDFGGVALVLGQAHGQGAQAAQCQVGVVGAYGQARAS